MRYFILYLLIIISPLSAFAQDDKITIASFNIQIFGKAKAKNTKVMAILTDIVKQFDVVAIQEIREKTDTAISTLMKSLGTDYQYLIGERLGRSNIKEQYAFIFNTNKVKPIAQPYTYIDKKGIFERPPLIAKFQSVNGTFDFVLVNVHIKPDFVLKEINELDDVMEEAKLFFDEDDVIALGDMNADCQYFNENKKIDLRSEKYYWLIDNSVDTNLAKKSCTFDRMIASSGILEDFSNTIGVVDFKTLYDLKDSFAKKVSDHFPVFAEFYINKDTK